MMRINLLPHREIRRKQQQQQFFMALGATAIIGAVLAYGGYYILNDEYVNQINRNKYLAEEIAKVDKEIEEINRLKEQTASLLARKQVVETLQGNRSETVHLLDQLVRQLPDGMYLRTVKQQGAKVTITGVTQDEPTNGLGDGDTALDSIINADGTVLLRAERSGKGSGRVYTITIVAEDASGNLSAPKTLTVTVPKSQGRKG